jgi:hypothetical protein
MPDAVLFELEIEVGIDEPVLRPVLFYNDVARLRNEVRMPLAAPGSTGERVLDRSGQ